MKRSWLFLLAVGWAASTLALDLVSSADNRGRDNVTAVLQAEIDRVSAAGGGRLTLRKGGYVVAALRLKSGVELHLEKDATLLGKQNTSALLAKDAENISLTGEGTIDGLVVADDVRGLRFGNGLFAKDMLVRDTSTAQDNGFVRINLEASRFRGKVLRFASAVEQREASNPSAVGLAIVMRTKAGGWSSVSANVGTKEPVRRRVLATRCRIPDDATDVCLELQCARGWGNTACARFSEIVWSTDPKAVPRADPPPLPPERVEYPQAEDSPEAAAYRKGYVEMPRVTEDGNEARRPLVKDGTWEVSGRPHFFAGVWTYNRHKPDFGPNDNPLGIDHPAYRKPPSKEVFAPMGVDSIQISSAHEQIGRLHFGFKLPEETESWEFKAWREDRDDIARFYAVLGEMPLALDFAFGSNERFPKSARQILGQVNTAWHEFVPFCPEHPEGRRYYEAYFLGGTRSAMRNRANVYVYELFNESSYDCRCRYNIREFARRMERKYGTIAAANAAWGTVYDDFAEVADETNVGEGASMWYDWCLFAQDRYVELLREGRRTVRSADGRQRVYFTEQCSGSPPRNPTMDYRKIAAELDVVTTEGGFRYGLRPEFKPANDMENVVATRRSMHFFNLDFFRALSKDVKPVHDHEHYCGRANDGLTASSKREDFITSLWIELFHGVSASYFYCWDKRCWEWKGTYEGAKANVIKPSYKAASMLNPYVLPPDQLDFMSRFRAEMEPYAERLLPCPRTKCASVAVYYSYPSMIQAKRIPNLKERDVVNTMTEWYAAFLHAQYPVKVVFEEDLKTLGEGDGVDLLVLPVATCESGATVDAVRRYLARGGRVIADREAFAYDERLRPVSAGLKSLMRVATPKEAVAAAGRLPVRRYFTVTPVDGIVRAPALLDAEVIDRGDFKLLLLAAMGETVPRKVCVRLENLEDPGAYDFTDLVSGMPVAGGSVTLAALAKKGFELVLPPQERVLLKLERKKGP